MDLNKKVSFKQLFTEDCGCFDKMKEGGSIENKHKAPIKDWNKLTDKEKKIYNSLRDHFSATSHDSAFDKAIQGGTNFQFYPK